LRIIMELLSRFLNPVSCMFPPRVVVSVSMFFWSGF
jgi:hypothetical protein